MSHIKNNSMIHMKRFNKRVEFSEWVIFLKSSLRVNHIFKRVQFLESLFKNSILSVTSKRKGFNSFSHIRKKCSILCVRFKKKCSILCELFKKNEVQIFAYYWWKMRFNPLRIIQEKKVQFLASYSRKKKFNS